MDKEQSLRNALRANRGGDPLQAEKICREFLQESPGSTDHLRLLAQSLKVQGRMDAAEKELRFALDIRPNHPRLREDLGSVLAEQGRYGEAIPELRQSVQLDPTHPLVHRKLATALAMVGRGEEADETFEDYFEKVPEDGVLAKAGNFLREGNIDEAVEGFKQVLRENPRHVDAMRFLAICYWRKKEHLDDAEALLRRAVEIAPDYGLAHFNLGMIQVERNRYLQAVGSYQRAVELEPDMPTFWGGLGNALALSNRNAESEKAYARGVAMMPENANLQMGYGHVLKTNGKQPEALKAYRASIAQKPDYGQVYWSMANLKIFRFEPEEVRAMELQLENEQLTDEARAHFLFALGKAYEDIRDFDKAWHFYDSGNQLQRMHVQHDPLQHSSAQQKIIEIFSQEFIEEHEGNGCEAPDPIFIVGLPRSGSTLVEQILASHSQVEGTAELPNIGRIAHSIGRYRRENQQFPGSVVALKGRDWRALGRQYLEETANQRELGTPYFTDKLPNNYSLVGLIHLVLPNARIINTRRHPLDSCLGAYKQLFARGQNFTYDQWDLGDYYLQYIEVMDHWRDVLPGKVLDVHYEETVLDLEWQVRRILAHCGLEFEPQCLEFWKTERAVRTASSEQVRQPIYTGALGKWRQYEKHLGVWLDQLQPVLDELPERVRTAGT